MIFKLERFHLKQDQYFGFDDIFSCSPHSSPRLTQDEKINAIVKLKALKKKASMLEGQKCDCFHKNDYYDLGVENICNYHQAIFDIKTIEDSLDIYKLKRYRRAYNINKELEREIRKELLFKRVSFLITGIVILSVLLIFYFN